MKLINKISTIGFIVVNLISCTKFVQVSPPATQLVGTTVYSTNSTASSALSGIYLSMTTTSVGGGAHGISALSGLSADEFTLYPGTYDILLSQTYTNSLLSTNPASIWQDMYNYIYQANSAIENITVSLGVSQSMKQ